MGAVKIIITTALIVLTLGYIFYLPVPADVDDPLKASIFQQQADWSIKLVSGWVSSVFFWSHSLLKGSCKSYQCLDGRIPNNKIFAETDDRLVTLSCNQTFERWET